MNEFDAPKYSPESSLMPVHAKYVISSPIGEFPDLDVSLDVVSWDELHIMYTRDFPSGVMTAVSFPIKMARKGKALIKSLFEKHQFAAQAVFSIYTRSWNPPFTYTHVISMSLDFVEYNEDEHCATITGVGAEINDYINSFGKNKYDIPVADIMENTRWEYQRMNMLNQGVWVPIPGLENNNPLYNKIGRLPIYLNKSQTEMTPGSIENDMKDQTKGEGLDDYFFKAAGNIDTLTIRAKFRIVTWGVFANEWTLDIYRINGGITKVEKSWDGVASAPGVSLDVDETIVISNLVPGDTLVLAATNKHPEFRDFRIGFVDEDSEFTVSYYANAPALTGDNAIPVIDPLRLMQKYLDLMAGEGKFTCEIDWHDEPHPIKLVAGESIRNYPLTGKDDQIAYLHGSPNDFIDFMQVLGYERSVDGTTLKFRSRDLYYPKDVTAAVLKEREISEFLVVANRDYAYTRIKAGCEKQDYQSINGRFEGNIVHEYTTGQRNTYNDELNLVSPYRTDPIGIELTTWERTNRYTDKKADNDIFAVALKRDGDKYVEATDVYMQENAGSASDIKMFNATLNPYYLIKRNESLIGIVSKNVHFTGSEGSKSTVIKSGNITIDPRQDIPITKKLHDPVMYNFDVGFLRNLPSADVRNGLVYFRFRGKTYKGFIQDMRKNHGHESVQTWGLWGVID